MAVGPNLDRRSVLSCERWCTMNHSAFGLSPLFRRLTCVDLGGGDAKMYHRGFQYCLCRSVGASSSRRCDGRARNAQAETRALAVRQFFQSAGRGVRQPCIIAYHHGDPGLFRERRESTVLRILKDIHSAGWLATSWAEPLRAGNMSPASAPYIMPDPWFVASNGYTIVHGAVMATNPVRMSAASSAWAVPWEQKRDAVVWRGHVVSNASQRSRLLQLSAALNRSLPEGLGRGRLDIADPRLHGRMAGPVLLSGSRAVVAIDGWANEWNGLFFKLLGGSAVLWVASDRFRMWYHHELVPWEHYIPVRSDMSDLADRIMYVMDHSQARNASLQRMAAAARQVVLRLSVRAEIARLRAHLQRRCGRAPSHIVR